MSKSVTVRVPATTANLGPGFDCIGAALTLYNEFKFSRLDPPQPPSVPRQSRGNEGALRIPQPPSVPRQSRGNEGGLRITVTGIEADRVITDESNLAYQSFLKLYQHINQTPPPVQIEINLGVPLARGLGSSATAIVGGLVGANLLAGSPMPENEVMGLAIALEGHPDNVVPALVGGCRLAATNATDWEICDIPWHGDIIPVVAIPDFELSTAEARRVLPTEYSRADAIFNTAHLGLLVRGLETGKRDWLQAALQDKIHQPYRQALIKGYDAVKNAALASGAYGMVISGAGPTLLALADGASAPAVATAMGDAWKEQGVKPEVLTLQIDSQGAKVSI